MSNQYLYPNVPEEKIRLRRQALFIRDNISNQQRIEKSNRILKTLYSIDCYRAAYSILTYVDYQSEVMTIPLIEKAFIDGKQVFCPRVLSDGEMEFYRIEVLEELKEGYRGIREPVTIEKFPDKIYEDAKTLIIVPGAAFDKNCYRIGYGKGFYDRYLTRMSEKHITMHAVGLGYECQMFDQLPLEMHDIRLDAVVTEMRVY